MSIFSKIGSALKMIGYSIFTASVNVPNDPAMAAAAPEQCKAPVAGRQCKRLAVAGGYCFQHRTKLPKENV
jgi:hypothetical protein